MAFTATAKAAEAEREAKTRRRVYPRWVEDGRLAPQAAAERIAIMDEIAADYRAAAIRNGEALL